jgi:hypothetical protein
MGTLYIAEFETMTPTIEGGAAQVARAAPVTEQTVTIAGGANASAAFGLTTRFVRLHTDSICSVAFGSAPVATAANMRMPASQTEYFGVQPGMKVSVITNT